MSSATLTARSFYSCSLTKPSGDAQSLGSGALAADTTTKQVLDPVPWFDRYSRNRPSGLDRRGSPFSDGQNLGEIQAPLTDVSATPLRLHLEAYPAW
jgi:hypothetical protein